MDGMKYKEANKMAYSPTEWQTGDIISAEKLNKLENGVANTLPTVTSDDNGDVLTVVEGAWAKAAPSGGTESFVVFYTIDRDDQTESAVLTCNKTLEELETAKADGKAIDARLIFYNSEGWYIPVKVLCHQMMEFTYSFDFVIIDTTYNGLIYVKIWLNTVSQPKKWEFTISPFALTPDTPT